MKATKLVSLVVFLFLITACQNTTPQAPMQVDDPGPENIRFANEVGVLLYGYMPGYITEDGSRSLVGAGSGVVVYSDREKSYVLTAGHCYTEGADYFVERANGDEIDDCYFIFVSATDDLGVLYVPQGHLPVAWTASQMPEIGSRIFVHGNKLGGGFWPCDGIYGGEIPPGNFSRGSTPVHPGNSGGGVFYNRTLIGIVSRIATFRGQLLPTMHMFVPVTRINLLMRTLHDAGAMKEVPERLTGVQPKVFPPKPQDWK